MTKHSISDLNKLYSDSDGADQEVFAEQRSNILLYSGDHYNRKNSKFYQRLRDTRELSNEQKLRITKNHTQYICDIYTNNICAPNPGVGFSPKDTKSVQAQKAAQLDHAVWRDAHEKYDIDDMIDDWVDNYVQVGEVATKIFFDQSRGKLKAYEHLTDEDDQPLYHGMGGQVTTESGSSTMGIEFEPVADEDKPIYEGEFVFEEVFGFNLLRPPEAQSMEKASWLGIRKMVEKETLQAQFPGDDNDKKIVAGTDQTYMIFDTIRGGYVKVVNQVLVIEYYFRPCPNYPNGYYYITTKDGILNEGELPGGIFPIVYAAFRKFPTAPRGRSPIKTMRPYQAEINRASSKFAEHQITLGDDKLILQNGTKASAGISLPGIRTVTVTGAEPKIMAGRDGSQYLSAITQNIQEMYQVLGVQDVMQDTPSQLDPYTLLFRSARQKKVFQRYVKRFEKFLKRVCRTYIGLARVHLTDDCLIEAVGKEEAVNISEFRNVKESLYDVTIEAQSEDAESKIGQQMAINHVIQYLGGKLQTQDIGKLIRQMPYANIDESFEDLTLDYDNAVNDILALDRGQQPPIHQGDDHVYQAKKLMNRMRKADFQFLPPQVQQNYQQKIQLHDQFQSAQLAQIQRSEAGFIPTGGYLSACDLYVPDANNPNTSKRVRLPSEALQWLIQKLNDQQSNLAPLADAPQAMQADISKGLPGNGQPAGGPGAPASSQTMINQAALASG